jgi:putative heme-binding domain-containing protein
MPNSALGALLACALPIVSASAAPAVGASPFDGAHWIWSAATGDPRHPDDDGCRLSLPFTLPSAPTKATAWVSADNHFRLFVDGHEAGHGDDWSHPKMLELASKLSAGAHRLDALCWNDGNAAAFLCALHLAFADGSTQTIVSDATWTATELDPGLARSIELLPTELPDTHARDVGAYGIAPWGKLEVPQLDNRFEPLPGFRVDVVADGVGSVVGIALDPKGRLYVASEGLRITRLTESASGAFEGAETYTDAIANAQGMFRDGDALFVTGDGPQGTGLYRVPEATRAPELLGRFDGEMGEHGPHAIVRGPDGWLYLAIGNHAGVAEKISDASPLSPLRYEGHLLPRYVDPRGHATQCRAPGGVVARVNEKTREWQLFAGGFRNHYDLCFDRGGALFTFDSDMEWDVGLPWYRAVRFVHVVPGGDYGWRTGSSTWPSWYADSLPPVCETGRGSPTGMCCYDGTQFPEHFRGAILAGDWSQGQILAFHPKRNGATFSADVDVLLSGRPLAVSDLVVARDGSLLFCVGGRGTAGGVYRLSYAEPAGSSHPVPTARAGTPDVTAAKTPEFTEKTPTRELLAALGDADRFVRYLAARALERRDPATFESEALALASPLARAEALVALARVGLASSDPVAWKRRLAAAVRLVAAESERAADPKPKTATSGPPDPTLVTALRALELLFQGRDGAALAKRPADLASAQAELSPLLLKLFPTGARDVDRELAQLLAYLGDAAAPPKLFAAFQKEPSRVEQIWLAYCLRGCKDGFTAPMRTELARWLDRGIAEWSGGHSFEGYLRYIRGDVDALLTSEERAALAAEVAARRAAPLASPAAASQEPRDLDAVTTFVERTRASPVRSEREGARLFAKSCASCHQIAGLGKSVGPELTTAAGRFHVHDLLEAILDPSRTISDQYRATNFFLKNGDVVQGIPTLDDGKHVVVVESSGLPRELDAGDVESRRTASKSLMPNGLVDGMTLEEIADLVAYVLAGKAVEPEPAADPVWVALFADATDATPPLVAKAPDGAPLSASDFVIEYEIKLAAPELDGGLTFRATKDASGALHGTRAIAGAEKWGALFDDAGRGILQQPKFEIWHVLADPHGWNHYLVRAAAGRLVVELNGGVTADYTDPDGAAHAASGLLGFDVPTGPAGARRDFAIRNVRIRKLEQSARN